MLLGKPLSSERICCRTWAEFARRSSSFFWAKAEKATSKANGKAIAFLCINLSLLRAHRCAPSKLRQQFAIVDNSCGLNNCEKLQLSGLGTNALAKVSMSYHWSDHGTPGWSRFPHLRTQRGRMCNLPRR